MLPNNALGAAIRDYSDDNHKPELTCALRNGFAVLCGFRPLPQTIALLKELAAPELRDYVGLLADRPAATGLRAVVTAILTEQDDHPHAITAVQSACRRLAASSSHWAPACAAYAELTKAYPRDPGVLVALLLNHVVLAEGEALFVQAGVAPCYLRGFGAELMASSDNVLRAGLTAKRATSGSCCRCLISAPPLPTCFTRRPTASRRHTRRPSEISGSAAFGSAHIGFGCRPADRRS